MDKKNSKKEWPESWETLKAHEPMSIPEGYFDTLAKVQDQIIKEGTSSSGRKTGASYLRLSWMIGIAASLILIAVIFIKQENKQTLVNETYEEELLETYVKEYFDDLDEDHLIELEGIDATLDALSKEVFADFDPLLEDQDLEDLFY